MQEDDSKIEITLLEVITYGLQTYSEELKAGSVHAYKVDIRFSGEFGDNLI